MVRGNEASPGRQSIGGIHFRGLCGECNISAGVYDGAYAKFADARSASAPRTLKIYVPPKITLPAIDVDPGSVARSILLGMCATSGLIKQHWPDFPADLLAGAPIDLPPEMRLCLALTRGLSARVAGPIAGFHLLGPNARRGANGAPVGINAIASVYFPPLAWELIYADETMLDENGWADVSSWTQIRAGEKHHLPDLVRSLPATHHPWHHRDLNDHWTEMFSTELVDVTECLNVEGGPRDPDAPPTLETRAYVPMDQMREIGRQHGIDPDSWGRR